MLDRTLRLRAPQFVGGNFDLAQTVCFLTRAGRLRSIRNRSRHGYSLPLRYVLRAHRCTRVFISGKEGNIRAVKTSPPPIPFYAVQVDTSIRVPGYGLTMRCRSNDGGFVVV